MTSRTVLILMGFLGIAAVAHAAGTNLPEIDQIEGDPVVTVLPPDGISAIDRPRFAPASKARFMQQNEPVLGVFHNGIAKAYSIWHLDRHEIVNDEFGSDPLAVTW